MPKFIKTIHDRVNFATKKGLTGYHSPEKITDEVHAESMNLWRNYADLFKKNRTMDVMVRPFQVQEIVPINGGYGIFDNLDYLYVAEGVVTTGFNKQVLNNAVYSAGTTPIALGGTLGKMQWIELSTAGSLATVILQIDGITIFSGQVKNKKVFVQFLYAGQLTLSVTITGADTTLVRSEITMTTTEIELVDDDKFAFRTAHPVKIPSATYPVATTRAQVVQVVPAATFVYIIMSLLKRPTKPFYAYSLVGDRYIYDDALSIDFEWNESAHDIIMERSLGNMGINMRAPEMIQFSKQERQMEAAKI